VEDLTSAYPTLASVISSLVSAEMTLTTLAAYQSSIQSLEVSYSTLLTDLSIYTSIAYPSVYSASLLITEATLTSPSIFASIIAVSTAVYTSSSASYALSYLSSAVYTLPSYVVTEILTIISSPSTVGASTVSSLEQCYSSVYYYLTEVTSFTYSYPSVVSDITAYLSAASCIYSIGSAVYAIISYQMPTFSYETYVLSYAAYTLPSVSNDLSVLSGYEALSPSLYYAELTIEQSFYNSPYVASSIYFALDYPSQVTSPSAISSYEATHESLVSALDTVISFESYYSSVASTIWEIETQLTTAFESYRTLLTAYSYVQAITSPSYMAATMAISSAKSVVSDVTYILSELTYVVSRLPSLSCAESVVEYYAQVYPTVAYYLWSVYDGYVSVPSSSLSYVAEVIASYPSLDSAFSMIVGGQIDYSFLFSLESSFIYAAESDSYLLSYYESFSYQSYSAYSEWSSTVSSSVSYSS
jgi:hypothetical protein